MRRFAILLGCAALLVLAPLATSASAQPGPPAQGRITTNQDCSVTIDWGPTPAVGASSYGVIVNFNGNLLGTFPVGNVLTVRTPPLPAGNWLIAIVAFNSAGQSTQGGPTSFIHSCGAGPGPGGAPTTAPTWISLAAVGSLVSGSFNGVPGADSYEVEGTIQATGQVIVLPIGALTSFSVPGVPQGNFLVRVRARNGFGVGPWSAYRLVVVGVVLQTGDLQVTLTWNTTADIDLHVIEPSGRHVFYSARNGITAFLDVDDTNGFGPENIYVRPGTAVAGTYQVYIVHYAGAANTTSAISATLYPGTANAQTAFFSRLTPSGNPSVGYNVANIDVLNRTISETVGTRDEPRDEGAAKETTAAAAAGSR